MKAVILLGAGASHGSIDVKGGLPPLGTQLFEALERKDKSTASRLSPELKQKFKNDFESGMKSYFEETRGNVMAFQRELAQYLAAFTPGPKNIYLNLLQTFKGIDVTYCSLNYDLLLELSAVKLKMMPCYGPTFPASTVKVLKIHGSSNFWPKIMAKFVNCSIYGASDADVVAPIEVYDQRETLLKCKIENSLAPAMSMYAEGKKVLISPEFINEQLKLWYQSVSVADFIFVIGVKVHSVDEHIWKTIASSKARLVYFGFQADEAAFVEWVQKHGKVDATFHNADFELAISILKTYITNK